MIKDSPNTRGAYFAEFLALLLEKLLALPIKILAITVQLKTAAPTLMFLKPKFRIIMLGF